MKGVSTGWAAALTLLGAVAGAAVLAVVLALAAKKKTEVGCVLRCALPSSLSGLFR